jgi:hypothetical protein
MCLRQEFSPAFKSTDPTWIQLEYCDETVNLHQNKSTGMDLPYCYNSIGNIEGSLKLLTNHILKLDTQKENSSNISLRTIQ